MLLFSNFTYNLRRLWLSRWLQNSFLVISLVVLFMILINLEMFHQIWILLLIYFILSYILGRGWHWIRYKNRFFFLFWNFGHNSYRRLGLFLNLLSKTLVKEFGQFGVGSIMFIKMINMHGSKILTKTLRGISAILTYHERTLSTRGFLESYLKHYLLFDQIFIIEVKNWAQITPGSELTIHLFTFITWSTFCRSSNCR